MLTVNVERLVLSRGGRRVTSYLTQRGFTYAEARGMAHGDRVVQLRDRTVQRLCEALVCMPNDLFGWLGAENDPLALLNKGSVRPLQERLEGLSQAEVEKFWAKVEELTAAMGPSPKVSGGVLRLDVGRLVRLRTVGSPYAFLQGMGLGAMVARMLLNGDHRALRLSVMTKLCQGFGCLPSDLYSFEGPEDHVLAPLRRPVLPRAEDVPGEVLRKLGH
ncbi:MAG: hypothetical protein K9J06_02835 [Flavobacteriales bacterium]|nr:hypothetical protein [Flavobacteriales bacterium]